MALTFAGHVSTGSSTDAASYAVGSISLTANRIYILSVVTVQVGSVTPVKPTIIATGETWTEDQDVIFTAAGVTRRRLTTFTIVPPATIASAISIDYGGVAQAGAVWYLTSVDGAEPSRAAAIVQSGKTNGSGTTGTLTLAAFSAAANMAVGCVAIGGNIALVPGTGFTAVGSVGLAEGIAQDVERKLNDNTIDGSWTSADWAIIGYEINEQPRISPAGSITPTGTLVKALSKTLGGTITPTGALALIGLKVISLAGSITPIGTLSKLTAKTFSGAITPTGSLARSILKSFLDPLIEGTLTLIQKTTDTLHLTSRAEDTLELDPLEEDDR